MMLMACDQSVRGFAVAAVPTFWNGDWSKVKTARFDGGPVKRGDERGAQNRFLNVYSWVDMRISLYYPNIVGFESYGFSASPDVHVVEVVGAIKLYLLKQDVTVETVQQSTARKLVCGDQKVPRKGDDAKKLMHKILTEHGAPATLSLDETDALVVLNSMLKNHGGQPLV